MEIELRRVRYTKTRREMEREINENSKGVLKEIETNIEMQLKKTQR
jgi:hypothetical protein